MKLTTTLNRLREAQACADSYARLMKKLGGASFDHDAPINLLTILEHNGVDDCIWSLRATEQDCDTVARLMAADFAEAVLPLFERECPNNDRPRKAIEAARAFAQGQTSAAANAAASAAASAAAWAAARAAANAAASAAANAAASAAASAAAWAAARASQAEIIRRYLAAAETEVSAESGRSA
jgi:hypothetical protein